MKARNCLAAGAAAVVFVNTDEELFVVKGDGEPWELSLADLPMVLVRASDGKHLLGGGGGNFTVDLSFTRSSDEHNSGASGDESEEDSDDDESYSGSDSGVATMLAAPIQNTMAMDVLMEEIRMRAGQFERSRENHERQQRIDQRKQQMRAEHQQANWL